MKAIITKYHGPTNTRVVEATVTEGWAEVKRFKGQVKEGK